MDGQRLSAIAQILRGIPSGPPQPLVADVEHRHVNEVSRLQQLVHTVLLRVRVRQACTKACGGMYVSYGSPALVYTS